jgi:hypothetical protein
MRICAAAFAQTDAHNQMPSVLLFHRGHLVDRRLGAQSFDTLRVWLNSMMLRPDML